MHWKPVIAVAALALGWTQAQAAGILTPTAASVATANLGSNKTFSDVLNFNLASASPEFAGAGGMLASPAPMGLAGPPTAGLSGVAATPVGVRSPLSPLREPSSAEPAEPASGEPETYLVLLASVAVIGFLARRRRDS